MIYFVPLGIVIIIGFLIIFFEDIKNETISLNKAIFYSVEFVAGVMAIIYGFPSAVALFRK